jgi:hypothetical protein
MSTKEDDVVTTLFVANTHTQLLFFTTDGIVYKLKCWRLPLAGRQARGKAIVNILPITIGVSIAAIMPVDVPDEEWEDLQIFFATSDGSVRQNALSDFTNVKSNGKIAADAPQHLAGRIEIDLVDDPQNDPLETRMQLVAGLLKQAGAARHSNGGRPAEVHVHLVCEQRRHTLKLNRERIIAEPEVLQRLRETVGTDCVRVVSGGVPRLRENGRGNGAKWASQRPQPAEV